MTRNDKPEGDAGSLEQLRAEIDNVDSELLALLERRFVLSGRIAASKQGQSVFRPGREAAVIRRLVSETGLDASLVAGVWRRIIAFSIDSQKQLRVALAGGWTVERTAMFRFGAVAEYTHFDSPAGVMDAVAGGEADIGVLPHWSVEEWWRELAVRRGRGDALYIVSTTPTYAVTEFAPVALLGRDLPDPSGKDTTLVHDDVGVGEKDGYDPSLPNMLGIVQQP